MESKHFMHPQDYLSSPKGHDAYQQYMAFHLNQDKMSDTARDNLELNLEAQSMMYDFSRNEKSVKVIFDQEKFSVLHISDNLEAVFGYTKEEFLRYNMLLFFHVLTLDHLAFPIKATLWGEKSYIDLPKKIQQNLKFTFCGIKTKGKDRRIRRLLMRFLALDFNEKGLVKTAIISIEDVSHLVKGDFYWLRMACGEDDEYKAHYFSDKKNNAGSDIITDREKDVLRLIAKGLESKDIGNELFISSGTVDNHRKNMIARTGARDTTALLQLCLSCGII